MACGLPAGVPLTDTWTSLAPRIIPLGLMKTSREPISSSLNSVGLANPGVGEEGKSSSSSMSDSSPFDPSPSRFIGLSNCDSDEAIVSIVSNG